MRDIDRSQLPIRRPTFPGITADGRGVRVDVNIMHPIDVFSKGE